MYCALSFDMQLHTWLLLRHVSCDRLDSKDGESRIQRRKQLLEPSLERRRPLPASFFTAYNLTREYANTGSRRHRLLHSTHNPWEKT